MAITPTVNRLQLGSLVRQFRERAKLNQEQLGVQVFPKVRPGIAQVRITKVESGERNLHEADLQKILDVCGITDPAVTGLLGQMQENAARRGRWDGYRSVYDERFRRYVDLETDASWIRQTALELVPDLVQLDRYVRALFNVPEGIPSLAVDARLARQQVYSPDRSDGAAPARLDLVMSDSCLRRVVGDVAIMQRQIEHLKRLCEHPHVTIQILPFDAPVRGLVLAQYSIVRIPVPGHVGDLDFVCASLGNDPRYLDAKDAVDWHEHNFQALTGAALHPDATLAYLNGINPGYWAA